MATCRLPLGRIEFRGLLPKKNPPSSVHAVAQLLEVRVFSLANQDPCLMLGFGAGAIDHHQSKFDSHRRFAFRTAPDWTALKLAVAPIHVLRNCEQGRWRRTCGDCSISSEFILITRGRFHVTAIQPSSNAVSIARAQLTWQRAVTRLANGGEGSNL